MKKKTKGRAAPATKPPTRPTSADRSADVDFAAAVLKGLIEHRDPGTYFGSTGALHIWRSLARKRGWVTDAATVTEAGKRHYADSGLEALPKTPNRRAYLWDWSGYTPAAEPPIEPSVPAPTMGMKNKAALVALAKLVHKASKPRAAALKGLRALGWVSGSDVTPEGREALQKGASEALAISSTALGNYNAAVARGSENVAVRELAKSQRYLDLVNVLEARGDRDSLSGSVPAEDA